MRALAVFFREDIENMIRSLTLKAPPGLVARLRECTDPAQLADLVEAYQHGYADALSDVARAVGVAEK
jgi:hypothetical protein